MPVASLLSRVKKPPVNTGGVEPQVQSLDQEDSLEKKVATHSSILAWEILWSEETGRLQSMGSQKSQAGLSD